MTQRATPASRAGDSTHEVIQQLAEQLSRLVRDEVKLAEAEMTRKGKRIARGAGLFGGSGVVAVYGLGCLLAAAVAGLATVLATWLAALIVAAVLFAVAGVAALSGRREISHATPLVPEQAIASVQADAETITEGVKQ
jgi:hypothetical protein